MIRRLRIGAPRDLTPLGRGPARSDRAVAVFHPGKVSSNCPSEIGHR
jgi:hypothetical protein